MNLRDQLRKIHDYEFRSVIDRVHFGTASDRYAGWIGQIYSEEWLSGVSKRNRTLGGKKFEERTVPVHSVEEYFEHFSTLEIDYTFYRALLDKDGTPSNNYFVLQRYADAAPLNAQFLLKAPQSVTARVLRRRGPDGPDYTGNPSFLDSNIFIAAFVEPALRILGSRFTGVLFEQEYQRKGNSISDEENVSQFEQFFSALPSGPQVHIELRSPHLLTPHYFDWIEHRGIGHIFSHWTWLPSIGEQWNLSGKRFTAANKHVVSRLLTPRKMPYARAYALAHPFDSDVPELSETTQARAMIDETAALVIESLKKGKTPMIISNNRAWGNAPNLARKVATRIVEEMASAEGAERATEAASAEGAERATEAASAEGAGRATEAASAEGADTAPF